LSFKNGVYTAHPLTNQSSLAPTLIYLMYCPHEIVVMYVSVPRVRIRWEAMACYTSRFLIINFFLYPYSFQVLHLPNDASKPTSSIMTHEYYAQIIANSLLDSSVLYFIYTYQNMISIVVYKLKYYQHSANRHDKLK
jgi:hypothetical protein